MTTMKPAIDRFRLWFSLAMAAVALWLGGVLPALADTNIVWSDEFNGTSISTKNWSFESGNNGGWGNNELEYYTNRAQNVYCSNGLLHIVALGTNSTTPHFTSARMKTQNKWSWTYGRVEARIKIPYGQGIWPAFWMLGVTNSWPSCGEIDIMENIGNTSDQKIDHGTLHGPVSGTPVTDYNGGGGVSHTYTYTSALANDFHLYAVEWRTNQIKFFLDSHCFATNTPASLPSGGQWVFTNAEYIILNLAVGGNWPGAPDATTVFPQDMQVDYIRVYNFNAPALRIASANTNGSAVLSWPTNIVCHLQSLVTNVGAATNWSDITGAGSPYVVPSSVSPAFYRLASP